MRLPFRGSLLSAALLCAFSPAGQAQTPTATMRTVSNFVTVTDEVMRSPKPEDWMMHRRNYQGWGYSPLEQINKGNVKNLQLVWARVMEPGINEVTPLIYNGIMFLGNPET
jgi:alcohol dehydrogenase (cytochrome c)